MILEWLQPNDECWFWSQVEIQKQIDFYNNTLEAYQVMVMTTQKQDQIEKLRNQILIQNNIFIIHFLEILLMSQKENQNLTDHDVLVLLQNQIRDYKIRIQTANRLLDDEIYIEPNSPELTISNQSMLEDVVINHETALKELEEEKAKLYNKVFA